MKFLNEIDGADKLKEDVNNRLVTDEQISIWDAKVDGDHTHNSSELPSSFQNLTDGVSNLPYRFDLYIYGDSNKYYPVHFASGNQDLLRTIKIWRSYSEQGPDDWNTPTHKGSLNLEWKGNYGSWGGAVYSEWLYENSSQYTTLFAGTQQVDNAYGKAFFLRGGGTGGAIYHIASDQPLSWGPGVLTYSEPTPFYNNDLTFDYLTYKAYAPSAKTSVDTAQIRTISVIKGSTLPTSLPADGGNANTVGGLGVGNIARDMGRVISNLNSYATSPSGFYGINGAAVNSPEGSYQALIQARNSDVGMQLLGGYNINSLWYRGWWSSGTFGSWAKVMHNQQINQTLPNTSYTTAQIRNVVYSTGNPSGGSNGDMWVKYT